MARNALRRPDIQVTPALLAQAMGISPLRAQTWAQPITDAIDRFGVSSVAMFLAQIGHESGGFQWVREIWGPTPAQARYQGRADLGNLQAGDGFRFRGRGLIQITGRANYRECGENLGLDLINRPELLELPAHAAASAAWYWASRRIDNIAEPNDDAAFLAVTRKINGGVTGLADRCERWALARRFVGGGK